MPKNPISQLASSISGTVHTDPEILRLMACDGLKIPFLPQAVIEVREPEDVKRSLQLANRYNIPVVPRGAGSTLTGSATPIRGGWVLDLRKLCSIRIDPVQKMVRAGAGVVLNDLNLEAAKFGLFYPPDPSSHKWCTVGGTIACNAGGLRCVKYGVTRDYVIALKGYLPTGEEVSFGREVRKFATGFNLRDLWIGSEGMLGVITEAVLRLAPIPESRWTLLCGFPSDSQALHCALQVLESGCQPSILEYIDTLSVKGAQEATGHTFFPIDPPPAVLLIELDGSRIDIEQSCAKLLEQIEVHTPFFEHTFDEAKGEELWEVRRKCSAAMFRLGDTKLNEDVVVPLQHMSTLTEFIHRQREQLELPIAVFGHAGDGNLHVNIMYNKGDPDMVSRAKTALDALMEQVIGLGGAISGEHGVGLAKSAYLRAQFSPCEINLMQQIKQVYDPRGILNPGKLFEPFAPWEHPKVEVSFPWDHR